MTPVELVETRISPDILDTIGRSFKFRHGSGVAEWLKNSLDSYLRLRATGKESRAGGWPVILSLNDGSTKVPGPNLALIDFGGTTLDAVNEFFLHWGSHDAAAAGLEPSGVALTGGHGNGGKFYMRQMWKDGARFLTWRDGRATSLVVERRSDGKTGYWEFKDREAAWRDALGAALSPDEGLGGAQALLQYLDENEPALMAQLDAATRGITVAAGRRAEQVWSSNDTVRGRKWDRQRLVDSIRDAAQARRPLRELTVTVIADGRLVLPRLTHEPIPDDPDWAPVAVAVPGDALGIAGTETVGELRVNKAGAPLTGRLRDRNAMHVLDDSGNPVASYPIRELPLPGHSPVLDFMHGELAIAQEYIGEFIQNDRDRLVRAPVTDALLDWAADVIWSYAAKIDERARQGEARRELELAALLNDELNRHARRFLEELQTQILVDLVEDPEGGGAGPRGGEGKGAGGSGTGGEGEGGPREVPGTSEKVRRPRFPQVLLSGFDQDPASADGETKVLTDRHPPLEQDDDDRRHNVWWINTEHVFAKQALSRGGAKGLPFRSYQLHMFRDVVQREALRYRQRREAELSLDRVENELTEVSNRFLSELPYELVHELLD